MLRAVGCPLPVELWHLGPPELDDAMRSLIEPLGVRCVDAREVQRSYPVRRLHGWELKSYALIHSAFAEVLLLDADNMVLADPTYLFEEPAYRETGAIFWPDYSRLGPERAIWHLCGIPYRDEPEFESGQIVIHKAKSWHALHVALHLNEYSDFYYRHIHGDKETFHMAWRKLNQPYTMPARGIDRLHCTMAQHDLQGRRLFQHRNLDKWRLHPPNLRIAGFHREEECRAHLAELEERWRPATAERLRWRAEGKPEHLLSLAASLVRETYRYHRVGHDHRTMSFRPDGRVGDGSAGCEVYWTLHESSEGPVLEISSMEAVTCRLRRDARGVWRGAWLIFERMPVELTPQPRRVGRPPAEEGHTGFFAARFPRLIHQIWLGPQPLPKTAEAWMETWHRTHPGWHCQLWTERDLARLELRHRALLEAAESPAMRSDILRYELLWRYGGLYVDVDFECFRCLEPLLAQVDAEAFGGFEWPTVSHRHSLCNALLGALPGSAFFARVLEQLPENMASHADEKEVHGVEWITRSTGPGFLTQIAAEFPEVTIFPQPVFYPHPHRQAGAYARHHFLGSWRRPVKPVANVLEKGANAAK
jgi:hypothetical protein